MPVTDSRRARRASPASLDRLKHLTTPQEQTKKDDKGEPTSRRIVNLMRAHPTKDYTSDELASHFKLSKNGISYNLRPLLASGEVEKGARSYSYRINAQFKTVEQIRAEIDAMPKRVVVGADWKPNGETVNIAAVPHYKYLAAHYQSIRDRIAQLGNVISRFDLEALDEIVQIANIRLPEQTT